VKPICVDEAESDAVMEFATERRASATSKTAVGPVTRDRFLADGAELGEGESGRSRLEIWRA
jgi:hypothetical protein